MTRPWLITGLTGTLAPHIAGALHAQGHAAAGWNRHVTPPDDSPAAHQHLHTLNPQGILHLALGTERWAHTLAAYAHERRIPFVFTSTAMVFHHQPNGPHHPGDPTTALDDYGQLKIRTEQVIRDANPRAVVARIGWQIHPTAPGNNMIQQLNAQHEQQGVIRASRQWIPATSFMTDTAQALVTLAQDGTTGTVHLDSNARDALTFPDLVRALARHLHRPWQVEETDEYSHDQRLSDPVRRLPGLRKRLGQNVT
ncbi:NAD(P)-dependent oxidoreductase [Deinococcus taeanensis]|uniref:sugar nucleotide-binding protein n=1 Tax=Deinococcus taeanensis TaxID=2737050 RepID=UPI001CDBE1C3|nr:sugar nucleotide-binding protein [Deinococcus taeanensis]UBV41981.1 NAD(P)-dependent oxidoreductase [Deinococcus taeanensis]